MRNTPEEHTTTKTDARLEDLEREVRGFRRSVRRQRVVIGGMAVLLAALAVGGTGQPGRAGRVVDDLRVKGLSVVDGDGKVRLRAGTLPEGGVGVKWMDREGKARIIG